MEKLGGLRKEFVTGLVRIVAGAGLAGIIGLSSLGCYTTPYGVYAIPDYCRRDYKEAVEKAQSLYFIKYRGENFCRTRDRWKVYKKIKIKSTTVYILKKGEQEKIIRLDEIRGAYPSAKELKNGIFDF